MKVKTETLENKILYHLRIERTPIKDQAEKRIREMGREKEQERRVES